MSRRDWGVGDIRADHGSLGGWGESSQLGVNKKNYLSSYSASLFWLSVGRLFYLKRQPVWSYFLFITDRKGKLRELYL